MNSWNNDHFNSMPNMMGMSRMMPNMMPQMNIPGGMPPFVPQFGLMGDMSQIPPVEPTPPASAPPGNFIGPLAPVMDDSVVMADAQAEEAEGNTDTRQNSDRQNTDKDKERQRSDRYDRNYNRDRSRRRASPSRRSERDSNKDLRNNHGDRNDRNYRSRSSHKERQTKWDNVDNSKQSGSSINNMMLQAQGMHSSQPMHSGQQGIHPGQMMAYGNMMPNPMMHSQMDMSNMSGMGMMQGMNMMPNMMLMNPQMQMQNQQMYFSNGMVLPPIPGTSTPPRRERPPGCRTVFVGGLPIGITEDDITTIFQRYGSIDNVKLHKQGVCHVRFENQESVENSFMVSGYRIKLHDQNENESTTLFVDYAVNRDDQNEYDKNKRRRTPTPPRVDPFTPQNLSSIGDKIKSDTEFIESAPTLAAWLERGECNKKNANIFYSLVQASNNQLRRLFNDKIAVDEEFQTLRNNFKDKFAAIVLQFEQVAKILTLAKHQRVSDHFSKQQRRNIEMWLKMTEEVENIKEEYNTTFDEEESEASKPGKNAVPLEKYEQLRIENENLIFELEGYKNEAHLAKDEAERKFEKFKAHFIAQQALQNKSSTRGSPVFPPLPPAPPMPAILENKPLPPPPLPDDFQPTLPVLPSEAKLISILSAFLMVHPLGATLDYLVSYVKNLVPDVSQSAVHDVLKRYSDVFQRKTTGVGANIEHKWGFAVFDLIKTE